VAAYVTGVATRGTGTSKARRQPAALPETLREADAGELDEDATLDGVEVTGDPPPPSDVLLDVELTEVRWSGGRFAGTRLRRPRCTDVVFTGCDLSGVVLEDGGFRRVEFHRCRMSGAVLAGSTTRDVLFSDCKLDLANLRMLTANRLEFLDCDLREADFYGATLTRSAMYDCDLTGAEFSQAETDGLRLHGSTLRDLKGVSALRGAVIAGDQSLEMAMALLAASGITVDDERVPEDARRTPPGVGRKVP
jgi:uncharacterized protein YjbI with pentapeptide repeats